MLEPCISKCIFEVVFNVEYVIWQCKSFEYRFTSTYRCTIVLYWYHIYIYSFPILDAAPSMIVQSGRIRPIVFMQFSNVSPYKADVSPWSRPVGIGAQGHYATPHTITRLYFPLAPEYNVGIMGSSEIYTSIAWLDSMEKSYSNHK